MEEQLKKIIEDANAELVTAVDHELRNTLKILIAEAQAKLSEIA